MELRHLEAVVAIADEGGFTSAARRLHVSQPSLSQTVKNLERELGAELFVRAGRTVRLTAAGAALLGPARRVLRDADTVRAAVDDVTGLRAGHLDLVCLATLAVDPVASLVGRFRRGHPGVVVRVGEPADAAAALDAVRDARAEVAVTDLGLDLGGLVAHPLATERLVAVVPVGLLGEHRRARRTIRVAELAGLPLVSAPAGTSVRRLLDDALAAAGVDATVAVETAHREAILALVAAGAGAAVVPAGLVGDAVGDPGNHPDGDVRVLEVRPPIERRIGLVHRDGPLSPAARAFVDVALDAGPDTRRVDAGS